MSTAGYFLSRELLKPRAFGAPLRGCGAWRARLPTSGSSYERIERSRSGGRLPGFGGGLARAICFAKKGARYPQRFASHRIVRSGQTQLKRAADQLQAPTSLVTRWNLPQAPK